MWIHSFVLLLSRPIYNLLFAVALMFYKTSCDLLVRKMSLLILATLVDNFYVWKRTCSWEARSLNFICLYVIFISFFQIFKILILRNFKLNRFVICQCWFVLFASHLTATRFIPPKACSERFCRFITQLLFGTRPIFSNMCSPGNILL